MVERVKIPEELGAVVNRGHPTEGLYDLGKGREKTELLMTYIDGDSRVTNRISSSPQITLDRDDRGILMNMTDSDPDQDGYTYDNLRVKRAVFEPPKYHPHELGDLVVSLQGDRTLVFSQYERPEQ